MTRRRWWWWWRADRPAPISGAAAGEALERAQRDYREAVSRRAEVDRLAAEVRRALGRSG